MPLPEINKGIIRIVAALINTLEKEEIGYETVTLPNITYTDIDMRGWFIADNTGKQALAGTIEKGDTLLVRLTGQVRLSNTRNTITILDSANSIIDQMT